MAPAYVMLPTTPSSLLELIREDQRRSWRQGVPVKAEVYLDKHPKLFSDFEAAMELIYAEFLLREESGEQPTWEEYRQRVPLYAERLRMQLDLRSVLGASAPEEWDTDAGSRWSDDGTEPSDVRWPEIDGYKILGEVGRGGMAVVYKAVHLGLKRVVAIKMIHGGRSASDDHLARFRDEAEAIARLRHSGIVQIHDFGEQDGHPYLSLEYMENGSLGDQLKGTPMPAKQAAQYAESIARAVHFAHEQGIIHRDLKPANVLLQREPGRRESTTKIADFGLAKILDVDCMTTHTGAIIGTPSYMAPEQASGVVRKISPATDIYALGAILYEMVTGRPPFRAESPLETLHLVIHQDPIPPRRLLPHLSRDLETICLKCLEKEASARYSTADELAEDLLRFQKNEPIKSRPIGWWERSWRWCRRNPLLASVAATALFLGVLLAIGTSVTAYWWRSQRDQAVRARNRIERTEREKSEQLWDALVANARSIRRTDSVGRRFDGLRFLRKASELRFDPLLRNEAIACLALSDLEPPERTWSVRIPAGRTANFDRTLGRYALHEGTGNFEVRRASDNRLLHRLPDPDAMAFAHCYSEFSSNGRFLGCFYQNVDSSHRSIIWDLENERITVDRHGDARLVWMPSGDLLSYETDRCSPRVLDATNGNVKQQFAWEVEHADEICIDPQGKLAALTTNGAPSVKVINLITGEAVGQFDVSAGAWPLAWSDDGRLLASGSDDHHIYVWSRESDQLLSILKGHQDHVASLRFHPNGRLLVSGAWDQVIRFWDLASGTTQFQTVGKQPALSDDGKKVAIQLGLDTLRVHPIRWSSECETVASWKVGNHLTPYVSYAKFDPAGRWLAAADAEGLYLMDVSSKRELARLPIGETHDIEFLPTGDMITLGNSGRWRWPVTSQGRVVTQIGPPVRLDREASPATDRMSVSADGRWMIVRTQDRRHILLIDMETQSVRNTINSDHEVASAAFSPDGQWVAAGQAWNSEVVIWNAHSGHCLRTIPSHGENCAVAFSPNGQWLVVSGQFDHTFWNTRTWKSGPRWTRQKEVSWPHPATFSDDGHLVAFEVSSEHIVLADGFSGKELAILTSSDRKAFGSLFLNVTGSCLAVARMDRTIQWWDLQAIRYELGELGLDWKPNQDRLETLDSDLLSKMPSNLTVHLGELEPAKRWSYEHQRMVVDAENEHRLQPDDAQRCNNLAWAYVTGPRDVQRPSDALSLVQKAIEFDSDSWTYQNTLGLVYYRLGEHDRAVEILERNVVNPSNWLTGLDRLILSMCYRRLGDRVRAQSQRELALTWRRHAKLSSRLADEFRQFLDEAKETQ